MSPVDQQTRAELAVLDARIADACAQLLERYRRLTTGQLVVLLVEAGESLTANSGPGRRKQVDRALCSGYGRDIGIYRVNGPFAPVGAVGRPSRFAWEITRNGGARGALRRFRALTRLRRGA